MQQFLATYSVAAALHVKTVSDASIMGAYAADILCAGKSNRVVAYKHGEFVDFDIEEALNMEKTINEYQYDICRKLSR